MRCAPFGNWAASRGPWFCAPASRRVCLFVCLTAPTTAGPLVVMRYSESSKLARWRYLLAARRAAAASMLSIPLSSYCTGARTFVVVGCVVGDAAPSSCSRQRHPDGGEDVRSAGAAGRACSGSSRSRAQRRLRAAGGDRLRVGERRRTDPRADRAGGGCSVGERRGVLAARRGAGCGLAAAGAGARRRGAAVAGGGGAACSARAGVRGRGRAGARRVARCRCCVRTPVGRVAGGRARRARARRVGGERPLRAARAACGARGRAARRPAHWRAAPAVGRRRRS